MKIEGVPHCENARLALDIYRHTLEAVQADRLMLPHLNRLGAELGDTGKISVCGAGKASVAMARACLDYFGERCTGGLVITKDGHGGLLGPIRCIEAGHPVPDERSLAAGAEMLEFGLQRRAGDVVLFCLSGGASALMEVLRPGKTLGELQEDTKGLLASGATIEEINRWRMSQSLVKAGGLGRAFGAARVYCFVLNDIVDGDVRLVGSGPFSVEADGGVEFITIGDHRTARTVAVERAKGLGLRVQEAQLTGVARDWIVSALEELPAGACLVATGEPVVEIHGEGVGGRCQEMALAAAILIAGRTEFAVLCGSTDGTDGPTEYAGGLVDGNTVSRTALSARDHLAANDSTAYLRDAHALLHTGPTGSNVNDLVVAIR